MRTLVTFTSDSTEAKKKKITPDLRFSVPAVFRTFYFNYPGEGGGVLKKFLYGEAPPRGPTPYPFKRKRYPFKIPSIDK